MRGITFTVDLLREALGVLLGMALALLDASNLDGDLSGARIFEVAAECGRFQCSASLG